MTVQAVHDRLAPILSKRDGGFRWRGREISRIEGLSDAVFAFAVTLLVVSLEPPKRFAELLHMMHGFVSFAICFAVLIMIWHSQYIYFRRYALDDRISFLLNALLLFVVAFYVYPMRFLFTTLVNLLTGYREFDPDGKAIEMIGRGDWQALMIIYNAGFIALSLIFALLYAHAYKLRDALELNELERFDTRGVVVENLVMIAIGSIAMLFAIVNMPSLSGMSYFLITPAQTYVGMRRGKLRRALEAAS